MICNECNVICIGEKQLSDHTMDVHEGRTINCPHCEFKSFIKKDIRLHVSQAHKSKNIKSYKCSSCEFKSTHFVLLKQHIRTHYRQKIRCDQCSYKTERKNTMKLHKAMKHILNERFEQLLLNLGNSHKMLLKKHNLSIKSQLSFVCNFCELQLYGVQDVKAHGVCSLNNSSFTDAIEQKTLRGDLKSINNKKEIKDVKNEPKNANLKHDDDNQIEFDSLHKGIKPDLDIDEFEEGELVKVSKPRGRYAKNKRKVDEANALSITLSEVTEQLDIDEPNTPKDVITEEDVKHVEVKNTSKVLVLYSKKKLI